MVPKDTFYGDKTLINLYACCNSMKLVKWRFRHEIKKSTFITVNSFDIVV